MREQAETKNLPKQGTKQKRYKVEISTPMLSEEEKHWRLETLLKM